MSNFTVHTIETAPQESKAILEQVKGKYGFVPNLMGVFAEAPEILKAYIQLDGLIKETALTPQEQQVVLLSISYDNACDYCMAAHTGAAKQAGVDAPTIEALRNDSKISDEKLRALSTFARRVTVTRGEVSAQEIADFKAAGYTNRHVLDVILAVAIKTVSNYTNHVAETPLDKAFRPLKWEKPTAVS